jgi:hypothetical protein
MAKQNKVAITVENGVAICTPDVGPPVELDRNNGDTVEWFSKDGDFEVSFKDANIKFDIPGWEGKKGQKSQAGVIQPASVPGSYMPTVIVKDADGKVLNPKGGGTNFQVQ